MAALVWLLIPLVAAAVAALWGRWAGRTRSTKDGVSLAGYERFRQAIQGAADSDRAAAKGADGEAA